MWTYLPHNSEGNLLEGAPAFPAEGTIFLAFDALRWATVLGYIEQGGYPCVLTPNTCDDCQIIAYSAIDIPQGPDPTELRKAWPQGPGTHLNDLPTLLFR